MQNGALWAPMQVKWMGGILFTDIPFFKAVIRLRKVAHRSVARMVFKRLRRTELCQGGIYHFTPRWVRRNLRCAVQEELATKGKSGDRGKRRGSLSVDGQLLRHLVNERTTDT